MSKDEIRNEILSLEDLGEMVPFFKTGVGKGLGRWLMRILGVNSINQINSDLCHLQGPDFASAALRHHLVDVEYRIHGEENLDLMREGQFLTVSNHPFGGIDGLILVDIVGHIRPDYKVLVNSVLSHISSLEEMWVPVVPNRQSSRRYVHDPSVNVKSLRVSGRLSLRDLPRRRGGALLAQTRSAGGEPVEELESPYPSASRSSDLPHYV